LITACDLPLLDEVTLQFLIKHRDSSFIATTFQSPHDQLPEPLIAIWEPESLGVLLNFMEKGYKCPRKVLINSSIKQLSAPNPSALMNVNKPEELKLAQTLLNQKR
jgi:molybdopterin-guanine dinucleotide biosynthesis protein A